MDAARLLAAQRRRVGLLRQVTFPNKNRPRTSDVSLFNKINVDVVLRFTEMECHDTPFFIRRVITALV